MEWFLQRVSDRAAAHLASYSALRLEASLTLQTAQIQNDLLTAAADAEERGHRETAELLRQHARVLIENPGGSVLPAIRNLMADDHNSQVPPSPSQDGRKSPRTSLDVSKKRRGRPKKELDAPQQ